MQDHLTRAQRYRVLATRMRKAADGEPDLNRRGELLSLAEQYGDLADRLVGSARESGVQMLSSDQPERLHQVGRDDGSNGKRP